MQSTNNRPKWIYFIQCISYGELLTERYWLCNTKHNINCAPLEKKWYGQCYVAGLVKEAIGKHARQGIIST